MMVIKWLGWRSLFWVDVNLVTGSLSIGVVNVGEYSSYNTVPLILAGEAIAIILPATVFVGVLPTRHWADKRSS
ncbi:MAG: hypothetical protein VKL39_05315 [Leptolyngbyaceae bacterium]|nr:hypothetical protein [Leptolyngbyaceae bacterium]